MVEIGILVRFDGIETRKGDHGVEKGKIKYRFPSLSGEEHGGAKKINKSLKLSQKSTQIGGQRPRTPKIWVFIVEWPRLKVFRKKTGGQKNTGSLISEKWNKWIENDVC